MEFNLFHLYLFLLTEIKADLEVLELDDNTGAILTGKVQAHSSGTMVDKVEADRAKRRDNKNKRRSNPQSLLLPREPTKCNPNSTKSKIRSITLSELPLAGSNPIDTAPLLSPTPSVAGSTAEKSPSIVREQTHFFSFDSLLGSLAAVIDLNGMLC